MNIKVKHLIEILSKQDPETNVFLEYDSMCCTWYDFVIAKVSNHEEYEDGIYLMCESPDHANYLFTEDTASRNYVGHTLEFLHKEFSDD
jgi:hypothetical protein